MIPIYKPYLTKFEEEYAADAVKSGWISSKGPYIEKFEEEFCRVFECKYAVGVNNGTAACHLALLAAGIKEGDEVIIPNCTFIATANAIKYCRACPVFVDIDAEKWNLDIELVEKAITPKTRAVFCVHLLGNPCNLDKLEKICRKYDILLIEDACEAIGSRYNNYFVGNFGKAAAFSGYSNKTCTFGGEGGVVTTNSKAIYDRIQLYKGQGQTETYQHSVIGYNYRMTNVQAAIGLAQLHNFPAIRENKERVYRKYIENLDGVGTKQIFETDSVPLPWMFAIKFDSEQEKCKVAAALERNDIEWRPLFYPISQMKPYRSCKVYNSNFYIEGFPVSVSEDLNQTALMLPSYPQLSNGEIDKICKIVKDAI